LAAELALNLDAAIQDFAAAADQNPRHLKAERCCGDWARQPGRW